MHHSKHDYDQDDQMCNDTMFIHNVMSSLFSDYACRKAKDF